jgi:hypothetical protein
LIEWQRVIALAMKARSADDVRTHRLEMFALEHFLTIDEPPPGWLLNEQKRAVAGAMAARFLISRVRAIYDGTIVVVKGPEVAALYPRTIFRTYSDVDLLVDDAEAVQRMLLAAGWEERGYPELYVDLYHERPLGLPGIPLTVEVHGELKWPERLGGPPPASELISEAVPSRTGVEGVLALRPEHAALCLAAHAWAHEPLDRIRDLLDIAVARDHADRAEINRIAKRWGLERVWRTSDAVADSLFGTATQPLAQRVWARHLAEVRERRVLEAHLTKLLEAYWELPFPTALRVFIGRTAQLLRPAQGEGWRQKLSRSGLAIKNATVRVSQHNQNLGSEAWIGSPYRKYVEEEKVAEPD